jgi:hypothetical protein
MATKELIAEALKLPPRTKARLASQLLEILDNEGQQRIDALWADEAGKMKSAAASQVLACKGKSR